MMKYKLPCLLAGTLLSASFIAQAGVGHDDHSSEESVKISQASNSHDDHAGEHDHQAQNKDHSEENHSDNSDGHEDEHSGGHSDEEATEVALTQTQQGLANIKVETLVKKPMAYQVYAPGEIKTNGYTSYLVSPRVDSVVLKRHVALGDHVKPGQPLITLFSETMADAQAEHRVNEAEWQRVQRLGRKTVGDKRYVQAQSAYKASYGRLKAFGLSQAAIKSVADQAHPLGEYTLNAVTAGAVLQDDFKQGQRVSAGESLIQLADETSLWVEARFSPNNQVSLAPGSTAQIKVGEQLYSAKVSQQAHTLDPTTRTRVVRLLVNNKSHQLHPGMFADVYFTLNTEHAVLAIPDSALVRNDDDGDWALYVETQEERFAPQEVELGRVLGEYREINGLSEGSRVVTQGAFFVASEQAKSGFDPHNH